MVFLGLELVQEGHLHSACQINPQYTPPHTRGPSISSLTVMPVMEISINLTVECPSLTTPVWSFCKESASEGMVRVTKT